MPPITMAAVFTKKPRRFPADDGEFAGSTTFVIGASSFIRHSNLVIRH
jgi:hypothetical protein